jgi:hypothetical protein
VTSIKVNLFLEELQTNAGRGVCVLIHGEILSSHGDEYEDGCLLGSCTM